MKKLYVIVSACEEENQIFEDWVPAESEQEARDEVEAMRGDYSEICEVDLAKDALKFERRKLKRLERAIKNVKGAQKAWDRTLGHGDMVRIEGKLLKLDGEEADRCEKCSKVFIPDGDSQAGVCPTCADKEA